MIRPRLEACYFPSPSDSRWKRLSRALQASAWEWCQGWDVHVRAITPPPAVSSLGLRSHVSNTQKLEHWVGQVVVAEDGARVLLTDADTLIVRPLDDIWDRPFDLAYTIRPGLYPFNGGVLFLRASARVRAFLADWATENRRLLEAPVPGDKYAWVRQWGGINQASLGPLLQQAPERGLVVLELPCVEWNCEDTTWAAFDPGRTRILHIKSALRRMALGFEGDSPGLAPLVALWRRYERQDRLVRRSA